MTGFNLSRARGLALYGIAVLASTSLIAAVVPGFDLARAFLTANLLALSVVVVAISWRYGRMKYGSRRAWKAYLTLVAALCIAAATALGREGPDKGSLAALVPATNESLAFAVLILAVVAIAMLGEMAECRRDQEARRMAETQAQLKLLQAQVEPHFLFNTLANLRHLVQSGSTDALPMLDHLVRYLRTALPEIRAASSTVAREEELARAYLDIMRIRMGGALEYSIDVAADVAAEPFPPLMLITLVENAVKHGIAPRGRGRIAIRACRAGSALRIEVEDDGPGLAAPSGRGVGLANLRERLRTLHGDAGRLELSQAQDRGMLAAIEVPR